MSKRSIKWQTPGSDVVHTIPEMAVVSFDDGKRQVEVQMDESGLEVISDLLLRESRPETSKKD